MKNCWPNWKMICHSQFNDANLTSLESESPRKTDNEQPTTDDVNEHEHGELAKTSCDNTSFNETCSTSQKSQQN